MNFEQFSFDPRIRAGIKAAGYTTPTPIQQQAIPAVLKGHDVLGIAQTGTGKTAAFALPILERLTRGPLGRVRALIVAPTRELAEQIHDAIVDLGRKTRVRSVTVYGGVSKNGQVQALRRGAEIVVACPGRLLDLVHDKAISLSSLEMLILDEADHMFDKGFLPDIRKILKNLPRKRQTLVFSATMPKEIRTLAEAILTKPATVQIDHTRPAATISHVFYQVEQKNKTALLKKILHEKEITTAIVFTRTKHKAKNLASQLQKSGCRATSLQGNLTQQKRQLALDGFKNGTYNIMVATDIAARGIDVSGISHVINFDMPATSETYTHRTGRTGRASRTGEAFTFATPDDHKMIKAIERSLGTGLIYEKDHVAKGTPLPQVSKEDKQSSAPRTRKKPVSDHGKRKTRRKRAVSFDFGVSSRV